MKSLVQEMVGNFQNRLDPYKLKVGELTGDSQMSKDQIQQTQVNKYLLSLLQSKADTFQPSQNINLKLGGR